MRPARPPRLVGAEGTVSGAVSWMRRCRRRSDHLSSSALDPDEGSCSRCRLRPHDPELCAESMRAFCAKSRGAAATCWAIRTRVLQKACGRAAKDEARGARPPLNDATSAHVGDRVRGQVRRRRRRGALRAPGTWRPWRCWRAPEAPLGSPMLTTWLLRGWPLPWWGIEARRRALRGRRVEGRGLDDGCAAALSRSRGEQSLDARRPEVPEDPGDLRRAGVPPAHPQAAGSR